MRVHACTSARIANADKPKDHGHGIIGVAFEIGALLRYRCVGKASRGD